MNPSTGTAGVSIPENFADFEKWRNTGEMPAETETKDSSEGTAEPETTEKPEPESDPQETETEGQDKPKRKGGFQRKIERLDAENQELRSRLEAIERGKPESKPVEGKPQVGNFDTYEEFEEALIDWKVEQREAAAKAKAAEEKAKEETRTRVEAWEAKLNASRKVHDDYDEVIESVDVPLSAALQALIVESEHGAELAYRLAHKPEEIERLSKLSPVSCARELGKLEAEITPAKEKPRASAAPAPIKPVGKGSGTTVNLLDPDLPYSEFEKLRNKQLR